MAVKVMFGFETGLTTDYWAWTGTHYVSSGDQQKVLPAWSSAQAEGQDQRVRRTGGGGDHHLLRGDRSRRSGGQQ